jgi:hypothetical protein
MAGRRSPASLEGRNRYPTSSVPSPPGKYTVSGGAAEAVADRPIMTPANNAAIVRIAWYI